MPQLVKFTGNNSELFVRDCADSLHADAQIVVPETHTVLLIKDGVVAEELAPGRHDIFDREMGFFRYKKDSDFLAVDFVFINKTVKVPMLWGTATPLTAVDAGTGVTYSLGMNGELEFRVKTPKKFYLELVGSEKDFDVGKLKKRVLSRVLSQIESIFVTDGGSSRHCLINADTPKTEIAERMLQKLAPLFEREYGLELCSLTVVGTVVSDADKMAIAKKRDELLFAPLPVCSVCGKIAHSGDKFCAECGSRLAPAVCACGHTLSVGDKFCPECGKKV